MGQEEGGVGMKEALLFSVCLGVVVLVCSSYYLNYEVKTWSTYSSNKCKNPTTSVWKRTCKIHDSWLASGSLGIIVGALQIIFGVVALILMVNGTGPALGVFIAHIFFFLVALIAFIVMALNVVGEGSFGELQKATYASLIVDWIICLGIAIGSAFVAFK